MTAESTFPRPLNNLSLKTILDMRLTLQSWSCTIGLLAFRSCEDSLVGQTVDEPEQLLEAITEFLNEIQPPEVVTGFSTGQRGCDKFQKTMETPITSKSIF
jgi:hypothetical protein